MDVTREPSRPSTSRTCHPPIRTRNHALVAAVVSVLAIWIVWGSLVPIPIVQDEYSYVLQSRIFAGGHWTAPTPPLPEFFQQAHVLTTPAVASKFFPGTALLMSPGSLLGAPMLVPLLLTGLTGALLFLLVRRVCNAWIAALAVIIWLSDPINLRFRAGYYSETTTSALWLISWWTLLEWRETRNRRWLLALAAAIGWGAITRPLTMLAFAIPIGIVVVRDVVRSRAWTDLALATCVGIATLSIIPLWSARTTGNWRLTPQTLYTRQYLPFDRPGFGIDTTPPSLPLGAVNRGTYAEFYREHVAHTPSRLPRIAFDRLTTIAKQEWWNERAILIPFVVLGFFYVGGPVGFAALCSLALFVAYLSYGHWAGWTLYYFEALPVLAVAAAVGIWRVPLLRKRPVAIGVAAVLAIIALNRIRIARATHAADARFDTAFHATLEQLPVRSAVIFVHYAPRLGPHATVVTNSPTLEADRFWIVNDLGERNRELMRYVGSRVPIAFYEDGGRFEADQTLIR